MFDSLKNNLSNLFSGLRKSGRLTEEHFNKAMREVRVALLEADVALPVVRSLTARIKEKAVGREILKSIDASDMIVKIVHDELVEVLGSEHEDLQINKSPAVIMMVGIQGAGKTTTTAKLASFLIRKNKKSVLMVSTDCYRPAAKKQLETLGKANNIDTLEIIDSETPIETCKRAQKDFNKYDVVIIDTAGRLYTDADMMNELSDIKSLVNPNEILIVADSLMGHEAVNIAKEFNNSLDLTGIILTRIDGDNRGGAALSMKHVVGKPIKFMGVGEKTSELEKFHPERIAGRILDKGDIVSLVEKAEDVIGDQEMQSLSQRVKQGQFNLDDLLNQLRNIKKLGSVTSIMGMIPGLNKMVPSMEQGVSDDMLMIYESILQSMTRKERQDPSIINGSRRKRIAQGRRKRRYVCQQAFKAAQTNG